MRVTLIAATEFEFPKHVPWEPDAEAHTRGAEALSEFAVLEHGSASFYIEGVSRALTHELIRHRQLSFSELSQRYVPVDDVEAVKPPNVSELGLDNYVNDQQHDASCMYTELYQKLYDNLPGDLSPRDRRKQAREAARSVLPNSTETKLIVTGNHRAWRHVLLMRGSLAADAEIRKLALRLHRVLSGIAPGIYQDIHTQITTQGVHYLEKV